MRTVSKFDVGVSVGKLKEPPKSCMPSSAKMKMNKKRRNRSDMMDERAFIKAITRFRSGDQYLEKHQSNYIIATGQWLWLSW